MDKSLKRKIGYIPPKTITVMRTPAPVPNIPDEATFKEAKKAYYKSLSKEPKDLTKEIRKQPVKAIIALSLNDRAVSWLRAHPYFKGNKALEDCGMKAGNASRMMKNGWKIPDVVLPKLVKILKQYGFVPQP